ncbi:MAG TPA: helicase, partial [Bdellovibrionales bacterium]|nr:helicase [Bdellovibrionales bacterium]
IFHGNARQLPQNAAVVITTYAILRIEQELLAAVNWDTIILDEAQTIRNPESQITRAAHRLQGSFRIALSGTPIENKLEDLWSQFQFLNPGLLGSRQFFLDQFETTQPEQQRSQSLLRLNRTVRPFLLRRLKKEVAAELPERIETVLNCTLSAEERSTYESILATSREEVLKQLAPAGGGNMLGILEILLRLRQACCHRGLVPGQEAPSSSKLELLLETLDTSLQEGHRSLIFSQWTSLLDLIEPHLKSRKIGFLRIDGATQKREEIVKTFQSEQGPPILLMSLKAGGVGLTLTAADHVFLLDPWWNPAAENQAADRAHRIGQTRSVMIHRLIAENTIEERILELQQHKTNLADSILKGGALSSALTREDLLALLAP